MKGAEETSWSASSLPPDEECEHEKTIDDGWSKTCLHCGRAWKGAIILKVEDPEKRVNALEGKP